MLASQYKLNSVEFTTVFKTGKKIHTDNLMVTYLSGCDSFKTAAVVSKKQTKTAIVRNYKRRVIFNAIEQLHINNQSSLDTIHMIVMLKKGSLSTSHAHIYSELEQACKKIK